MLRLIVEAPRTLVVLGRPSCGARAGFSMERAQGLVTPYPGDDTPIARPAEDVPEVTFDYSAAISAP